MAPYCIRRNASLDWQPVPIFDQQHMWEEYKDIRIEQTFSNTRTHSMHFSHSLSTKLELKNLSIE